MNDVVFGKTMEIVRKHRDIILVTSEVKRNYLVAEPRCYTTNFFLLAIERKRTRILINTLVYLDLSILEISKTVRFWCDYLKSKYEKKHSYVPWIQTALQST